MRESLDTNAAGRRTAASEEILRLRRARLYIDAAAFECAHELLAPGLFDQDGPAPQPELPDDPGLRLGMLSLAAQTCWALGHPEHLATILPRLEDLCRPGAELWPEECVRGTAVLAQVLNARGEYGAAATRCRSIPSALLDACSPQAASSLLHARFHADLRSGDFDGAEKAVAHSLHLAERTGDLAMEGNARGNMALVLKYRGRLHEALRLYTQAANLHRTAGDYAGTVQDELNRAALLNRIGLLDAACQTYEEAGRKAARMGHRSFLLNAQLGEAAARVRQGDANAGRALALKCWRDARRQRQPRKESLALQSLAEALVLGGHSGRAGRAIAACRRIADRIAPDGDLRIDVEILSSFAGISRGELPAAESHARAAVCIAARLGSPWEEAQAHRLLGSALALQERPAEAASALERARAIFETMGEQHELAVTRAWLDTIEARRTSPARNGDRPPWPALHGSGACTPAPARSSHPALAAVHAHRTTGIATVHPVWRRLGVVAHSPRTLECLELAQRLAEARVPVLITGETGTGKDIIARAIHEMSGRTGAFVPFNCAGCPEGIFESEIFGAERGAYTGADRKRPGLVTLADAGTLFLDEVGDLRKPSQGSLLRFLDSGEVRALGSNEIRNVQVGVVSATLRPIERLVADGSFRPDLYYRLARGILRVPPLRERPEDLSPLVDALWRKLTGEAAPAWLRSRRAEAILAAYSWPGNIRELETTLDRLRLRAGPGRPEPSFADLERIIDERCAHPIEPRSECLEPVEPDHVTERPARPEAGRVPGGAADRETESRRRLRLYPAPTDLTWALREARGDRNEAARLLGISRATLYRLLRSSMAREPGMG